VVSWPSMRKMQMPELVLMLMQSSAEMDVQNIVTVLLMIFRFFRGADWDQQLLTGCDAMSTTNWTSHVYWIQSCWLEAYSHAVLIVQLIVASAPRTTSSNRSMTTA